MVWHGVGMVWHGTYLNVTYKGTAWNIKARNVVFTVPNLSCWYCSFDVIGVGLTTSRKGEWPSVGKSLQNRKSENWQIIGFRFSERSPNVHMCRLCLWLHLGVPIGIGFTYHTCGGHVEQYMKAHVVGPKCFMTQLIALLSHLPLPCQANPWLCNLLRVVIIVPAAFLYTATEIER